MDLDYYIPRKKLVLRVASQHEIPILGIYSFFVKIDRLEAEYKIWVDTKFVSNFIMGDDPLDGRDVIKMGMWEVNLDAFLLIDNRSPISCQIDIVSYISNKHSYLVEISFLLDKKHIKGYFYDEKEPTYIDNKFDVIDLE